MHLTSTFTGCLKVQCALFTTGQSLTIYETVAQLLQDQCLKAVICNELGKLIKNRYRSYQTGLKHQHIGGLQA